MVTTNIPREARLYYNGNVFCIGDRVRVLMENKSEYIGEIHSISSDTFSIRTCIDYVLIETEKVSKMRETEKGEDFNNTDYYDDEEREFWRTHWITRNGIEERENV